MMSRFLEISRLVRVRADFPFAVVTLWRLEFSQLKSEFTQGEVRVRAEHKRCRSMNLRIRERACSRQTSHPSNSSFTHACVCLDSCLAQPYSISLVMSPAPTFCAAFRVINEFEQEQYGRGKRQSDTILKRGKGLGRLQAKHPVSR